MWGVKPSGDSHENLSLVLQDVKGSIVRSGVSKDKHMTNTNSQNKARPPHAIPRLRGTMSKQEVFDIVQNAAHTIAIHLNYMRAEDKTEFPQYIEDGSLVNGEEIRRVIGGRRYSEFEILALIELGRYYQNDRDIDWHDIQWGQN